MNLLKLLQYIEKRPRMYIRDTRLELLESFISGYFLCQAQNKIASKDDEIFRAEFYDWIYSKYNNLSNDISWLGLIRQISQNESKEEFDMFFELLKDFNKDKGLL